MFDIKIRRLYKVFIRDFRDTDTTTNVIVENKNGNQWLIKFVIDDNGDVNVAKPYFEDTDEESMYRANHIKKVSFER